MRKTLRGKVLGGFILMAGITLLVGIVGWNGIVNVTRHLQNIERKNLPGVQNLLIINKAQATIKVAEQALLNQNLEASRQQQYHIIETTWQDVDQAWNIYANLPKTAGGRRTLECLLSRPGMPGKPTCRPFSDYPGS